MTYRKPDLLSVPSRGFNSHYEIAIALHQKVSLVSVPSRGINSHYNDREIVLTAVKQVSVPSRGIILITGRMRKLREPVGCFRPLINCQVEMYKKS